MAKPESQSMKFDDDTLKKFYRSFHKHAPPNWAKMAKDARLTAEQCEGLHKQHQAFLSLPPTPALETAFLALVADHYNAKQELLKSEAQEEEVTRSGRVIKRPVDPDELQGTSVAAQKPKRTPKPTPQRLAAEEEAQARRQTTPSRKLAAVNQGTPKSAKAKSGLRGPPSPPPPAEWGSPHRKRSRKLFEDQDEQEAGRYRSPVLNRWRERHSNDVDEGVDALLSLASGAHASGTLVDNASMAVAVGTTADMDLGIERDVSARGDDGQAGPLDFDGDAVQMTPRRRGRGGGLRGSPAPNSARGTARAELGLAPAPSPSLGLRSPRGRAAAAGATPGRAGRTPRKEPPPPTPHLPSPTTSSQLGGERKAAEPQPAPEASEGGAASSETVTDGAPTASGQEPPPGPTLPAMGSPVAAGGRPVRIRKPSAIALAAAAMGDEDDSGSARHFRAAAAAAVAAAAAAAAMTGPAEAPSPAAEEPKLEATGETLEPEAHVACNDAAEALAAASAGPTSASGGGRVSHEAELLSNTDAILAAVAPVRTRGMGRGRRGVRRPAAVPPIAPVFAADAEDAQPERSASEPANVTEMQDGPQEPGPAPSHTRGPAGASSSGTAPAASAQPPAPRPPPLPRARRRKAVPERLPEHIMQLRMFVPRAEMPIASLAGATSGRPLGAVGSFPNLDRAATGAASSSLGQAPSLAGAAPPLGAPSQADAVVAAASAFAAPLAQADALANGVPGAQQAGPGPASLAPIWLGEDGEPMLPTELALRHCLNSTRVRRWCMYEFHYSAIDRPWFLRNELLEFCTHMQLPTHKLTRLEWSVLRGALGRPRRLSQAFLREERIRLEGYRESVRVRYDEVGVGLEVPPEMPRPLRVGQGVTARHPATRQLHDGLILTVKGSKYRVQFNRSELMTEVVGDVEVMPRDPHECLPLIMVTVPHLLNGCPHDGPRLPNGGLSSPLGPLSALGMGGGGAGGSGTRVAATRPPVMSTGGLPYNSWATGLDNQLMREQDAAMVDEVQRILGAKEELVKRCTQLNNEAQAGMHTDEAGGRTEHFQLQYSTVVMQLKDTNDLLYAALERLQNRQQQVVSANAASVGTLLALQQQQAGRAAGQPQHQQLALQQLPSPQPPSQQQQQQALGGLGPHAEQLARAQELGAGGSGRPTPSLLPSPSPSAPQQQPPGPALPLVVPPPRPSTAAAAGAAAQQEAAPPHAGGLQQWPSAPLAPPLGPSTAEQFVEAALAEARSVVDAARAKGAEQGGALSPPQTAVPAVAQGPGMAVAPVPDGGQVPLVLPPSGLTPQPPKAAAPAGNLEQQQEHAEQGSQQLQPGGEPPCAAGDGEAVGTPDNGLGLDDLGPLPSLPSSALPLRYYADGDGEARAASTAMAAKREEEEAQPGVAGAAPDVTGSKEPAGPQDAAAAAADAALSGEALADSWLRDVIVGCVGMLFTVQRCTAGGVPAGTITEALDLALQALKPKAAANEGLYQDIVSSVQGLKGYLTRASA